MQIFISYRRSCSWELSRLIYQRLIDQGFSVFIDLEEIRGGNFDEKLTKNIETCEYFLPILSQGTLNPERISNKDDWVRKEIELALALNKRIIPIISEGFTFPTEDEIPDSLRPLSKKSGVRIPHDYFDAALEKLINEYLVEKTSSRNLSNEILDRYIFQEEECIDFGENIIATFECEADEKSTLEDACRTIAYDPTIGTWTSLADIDREEILTNYCGKVLLPLPTGDINRGRIRVAFPIKNIDASLGGIPHLLAILGAPFGLKIFKSLRLLNIQIPESFSSSFHGPKFGLDGVYELLAQEQNRPLLATMLKPRSGLDPASYAKIAYEALIGGVDLIFDDELMVSPNSAPLEARVPIVDAAVQRAAEETGLRKYYAVNITSSMRFITQTSLRAKELGADLLYFNPLSTGFSGLEILAENDELNIPVLCCRSLQGVFHRGENGIDIYVLLKLARLAGADGMHIGSISGKLPHLIAGGEDEIKNRAMTLTSKSRSLRPMIPILSGGIHPGNVEWNIKHVGSKVILQAGSGVLGHPDGARAGGKAMRDLLDGLLAGQSTFQISQKNDTLYQALKKWGYVENGKVKSV